MGEAGQRALLRGAHSVAVILADVDAGKLPKLRHIERFVKDTLVYRSFTEEAKGYGIFTFIFAGVGHTGTDADLAAYDAVAAIKLVFGGEHMHRPTFAFNAAADLSVELGHYGFRRHALDHRLNVVAISRDHHIFRF